MPTPPDPQGPDHAEAETTPFPPPLLIPGHRHGAAGRRDRQMPPICLRQGIPSVAPPLFLPRVPVPYLHTAVF